jgi:hypothetical protein
MSPRNPIVVWCNHGIADERGDFVQRYRWHSSQGKWIPSDSTAEGNTFVPVSDPPASASAMERVHHRATSNRQHYNAQCKKCPRLVAMRERGAQLALTRIWDLGLREIPLSALQHAYDQVPQLLR